MQGTQKENIKKSVESLSDALGLGNILSVFSRLDAIANMLSSLLPQMERLIELMENTGQVSGNPMADWQSELREKLEELLSIAQETREDSGYVKMVFTREKPKQTRKKVHRSEAVNEYLHKYNRSMKP